MNEEEGKGEDKEDIRRERRSRRWRKRDERKGVKMEDENRWKSQRKRRLTKEATRERK